MEDYAKKIEDAVESVLNAGVRTGDIMGEGCKKADTKGMGNSIVSEIKKSV
jgi:3-isopropylmalate dehydrogenase